MLKFCDSSPCDFNQALFQVNNKLIFKHQALTDVALVFRFAQSWDNEKLLICEKNPYNREVKGTLMSSPFTGRCHKQPLVDCLLFKECFCHLGTKFTYFAIKMQNLGRSAWLFLLFSQEAGTRLHKQPSEAANRKKLLGWARCVVCFWNK